VIVVIAPAAEADMGEILDYIAIDNPGRAESFVDEIIDRCLDIPEFPEAGTARPDVADGARSIVHGRYLILYRLRPGEVRIERIVHGSRSLPDSL
jgi:toxin ParE1/3/4